MTTYNVKMDDGHEITVKAWSAADAIQSALTKHLGHRVSECFSGMKHGNGRITYDIPRHDPVMEKTVRAARPSKVETDENRALREKPADWMEGWLKTHRPV